MHCIAASKQTASAGNTSKRNQAVMHEGCTRICSVQHRAQHAGNTKPNTAGPKHRIHKTKMPGIVIEPLRVSAQQHHIDHTWRHHTHLFHNKQGCQDSARTASAVPTALQPQSEIDRLTDMRQRQRRSQADTPAGTVRAWQRYQGKRAASTSAAGTAHAKPACASLD